MSRLMMNLTKILCFFYLLRRVLGSPYQYSLILFSLCIITSLYLSTSFMLLFFILFFPFLSIFYYLFSFLGGSFLSFLQSPTIARPSHLSSFSRNIEMSVQGRNIATLASRNFCSWPGPCNTPRIVNSSKMFRRYYLHM